MKKHIYWAAFMGLALGACSSNDNNSNAEAPLTNGTANFSKYVSLGNSITAGYADGALFAEGQKFSYAKLLSDQFATVGGGTFNIPYMNDNLGGLMFGATQIQNTRLLYNVPAGQTAPTLYNAPGVPTTQLLPALTGDFNNFGVPGAKSFHLIASGYGSPAGLLNGSANPYFVRFAKSATTTVLADAMAQQPTFFSLWIGNNDVLSYATSGGVGVNQTGNPNVASYGSNDITDPGAFDNVYNTLVNNLTSNGAKGVVASIPYVSSLPYFTTVPTNPIPATSFTTAQVAQLNQLMGAINQILAAGGQAPRFVTLYADDSDPNTVEPNNPLLINDESLADISAQIAAVLTSSGMPAAQAQAVGALYGKARHAKGTGTRDYVLLTTRTAIGTTVTGVPAPNNILGVTYPMGDKYILTATEVAEIKTATDAYNASIKTAANAKGLAFVDANALMLQLANGGIRFDNYHMSTSFIQGGAFGLDGVHLTPRGNAYIANQFMMAINATYGSTLRMYHPDAFPMNYSYLPLN